MKNRMKKEFINFEGGLFSQVEKADLVDIYTMIQ